MDDSGDPSVLSQPRSLQSRVDLVPGDVGNQHYKLIDMMHPQRHETAMDKEP